MMLALEGVSLGYDGRPVLADVSFSLAGGEQALLLGPSGSGKTTLIYLCCGLLAPDRGAISVDGEDLTALSQSRRDQVRRRGIGVVFQTLRLVSPLCVRANLLLAQRLADRKHDVREADALLERLGIAHRASAKPAALSQGEAQRAAIARALIAKPKLLIADEPTSALDDANAERVAVLIMEAARDSGASLLIATHDARLRALAPRTIELAATAEARLT